ncbi:MAG: hypothetical protein JSS76_08390 [Bacteroidetes bacterium]|nr:hypothetical protein [Bacteroidota bacterium]
MSEEIKGVILAVMCGAIGWLWKEVQSLIKANEVAQVRIKHLEEDNRTHKENHSGLYEKLMGMVAELKEDISDLKEAIAKHKL